MEEKQTRKEEFLKLKFFKKVWYSITKFEKYPEMAALGVKKAMIYFTELMIIFTILFTGTYIYYISNVAEFEKENLSFSEKIVTTLTDGIENEQLEENAQMLNQYNDETLIAALFISFFIYFYIATLIDVFTLSIFGLLTCIIAKIKMNYKAIFNMSIFSLTLAIILRIIYSIVTMLTTFEVKYFNVMYVAVSYISLAAAIFLIKSDIIKQHLQLIKIIEESKEKIEETITIPKKPKEDKKEDDDKETDEKKDEKEGEEEQGLNA